MSSIASASPRPSFTTDREGSRPGLATLLAPSLGLPQPGASSASTVSHASSSSSQVEHAAHPSHPSSPWSILNRQTLPLFNGAPLKLPVEELASLCSSHVRQSISRAPNSYRSLLSSDLQEIIGAGMLTLRAKVDASGTNLLTRLAEVWAFLFGSLPYLQGIFLPLSQQIETDARRIALTGFLLHVVLPILPRLADLLAEGAPDARLQQMALVLATQARPSSFFTFEPLPDDAETRRKLEHLAAMVRPHVEEPALSPTFRRSAFHRPSSSSFVSRRASFVADDSGGPASPSSLATTMDQGTLRGPSRMYALSNRAEDGIGDFGGR